MIPAVKGGHLLGQPVSDALRHAGFPLETEPLAVVCPKSASVAAPLREATRNASAAGDRVRLAKAVQAHHAFVWRSLRRLGVRESDVDDATQKVFLAVADKLQEVAPERERSYLFATAVRVAANERRAQERKRYAAAEDLDAFRGEEPSPEQATADRALLDKLLHPLPLQLRSVFILFELEQMTKQEIAAVLDLPEGTVASRLRRARELVEAAIARMRAAKGGAR